MKTTASGVKESMNCSAIAGIFEDASSLTVFMLRLENKKKQG